jgi:REP element-mobilizing transposase RayT
MDLENQIYLFVHLIFCTADRKPLLKKPLRRVLFGFWQSWAEKNLIRIISINAVEDHVHCLIRLHPNKTLAQVMNQMKQDSACWINENKVIAELFEWDPRNFAYSVSPGSVKQVTDYIGNQELHHLDKTLTGELESFEKIRV